MKVVTIVPGTCQTYSHLAAYRGMMRTHKATCDSELHFYSNEIYTEDHEKLNKTLSQELTRLGYFYHRYEEPFSLTKIWNQGLSDTSSDYVVYSIGDMLFLSGWLDPLITLLDTGKYHSAQGVTRLNDDGMTNHFDAAKANREGFLESDYPCGSHFVMRRSDGFEWDEEVGQFYPDIAYREYLKHTSQLCAISGSSELVHMSMPIGVTKTHSSPEWGNRELKERKILEDRRLRWASDKR